MKVASVILAAGQGTRMKSAMQKVLHLVCGKPMIAYSLEAAASASTEKPVAVVASSGEAVHLFLGESAVCVVQAEQLGTGHAVMQAEAALKGKAELILVTYADMPLLRAETLQKLVEAQKTNPGPMTILTIHSEDARGFGRVVREADGNIRAVVEEAAATPEQLSIQELNAGVYCFAAGWLWQALPRIPLSKKGEYYLTEAVALAARAGMAVRAVKCDDLAETIGINTRVHLAEAEAAMRARINRQHMLSGVTLIDPASTYIEADVRIGSDTVVWPNTCLRGQTVIGAGCTIGPNTLAVDTIIGDRCEVLAAVTDHAVVEDDVNIGPFARLRKGAHLCKGVHMGNFGEVKDSTLGPGTKMGHFSYIGNAAIAENVNIGAGTITCNFDGVNKNPTEIGENAFIGSDTMLVAPVKIGARSKTGAGSVVTKNVDDDTLVVGVPAHPVRKLNEAKDAKSE
jgi:bifunctional UDP-N-acetylglucosamine pyrophosphorylase/glucosamine-1-phosphate N-acetyltransferase